MMESDDFTIVPIPWWVVIAVAVLFGCTGCASERFLTEEQDAEMKASCEEHGCTVIPNPIWFQMREILKHSGAI
jgi:hypothetical protein